MFCNLKNSHLKAIAIENSEKKEVFFYSNQSFFKVLKPFFVVKIIVLAIINYVIH